MLKIKRTNGEIVTYKHVIEPIRESLISPFEPNTKQLKKAFGEGMYSMVKKSVEECQREGKTIIINTAGGWCFYWILMK